MRLSGSLLCLFLLLTTYQSVSLPGKTKKSIKKINRQRDILGILGGNSSEDKVFFELIKKDDLQELFRFSDLPIIDRLPSHVKGIFDQLVIRMPEVHQTEKGFSVSGQIDFSSYPLFSRIIIEKQPKGKTRYSILLSFPKTLKFSEFFPKGDKFDPKVLGLLEFDNCALVLTNVSYFDPDIGRDMQEGLNFVGRVRPSGPLFKKLDKLTKGNLTRAGTLNMQGVLGLKEAFVGTMLLIDLTSGIKFTDWLETTPLTMVIAIEDRIEQTPTAAVSLTGGLKIKFPHQDWNTFALKGKYIMPEDFEFYAFQEGIIKDFPIKGLHSGNFAITTVTDIALLVETEGVALISGLGMKGSMGIGDSVLTTEVKAALSGTGSPIGDMHFKAEGDIRLNDLIGFVLERSEDIAHLAGKDVRFKERILKEIPPLMLEGVHFAFVPKETVELKKQIGLSVENINLFGLQGKGAFYLDVETIHGDITLPPITLGPKDNPLFYLKSLNESTGLNFYFHFDRASGAQLYANVVLGTSLFGGVHHAAVASLSSLGMRVSTELLWQNFFDAVLEFRVGLLDIITLHGIAAHVRFKQSAQDKLGDLLSKVAEDLLYQMEKKLDKFRAEGRAQLEYGVETRDLDIAYKIARIEAQIEEKKQQCDLKHSSRLGQKLCYAGKGVPLDKLKIAYAKLRKKLNLDVVLKGGKAALAVAGAAHEIVRPIGKFMKFLSKIVKKGVNIRLFEASGSLDMISKTDTLNASIDMTIAGKDVRIDNFRFDVGTISDLIGYVFDKIHAEDDQD